MSLQNATLRRIGFFTSARSYWFRGGGLYSISASRILLFIVVYQHALMRDCSALLWGGERFYGNVSLAAFKPKGLVGLFGAPPPVWLIDNLAIVAQVSTVCAIIGLCTRVSMVASVLSVTFLLSLSFSFEPYWSHGSNVVMLAGLAMMFGRAGDFLSVDYLIRKYILKWESRYLFRDGSYWWPVLLAQAAVALFYFAGFYAKISGTDWHWSLAWVFSDNLRHSLLRPWIMYDHEPPWYVLVAASQPILWKLLAAGHLANQALPLMAVVSTRRPFMRLIEGAIFAAGAPLLGFFMGIWNLYWMLLATFFVDWDYFIGRFVGWAGAPETRPDGHSADAAQQLGEGYRLAIGTYVGVFLAFYIATFLFRLSPHHKAYPFSWMGFYSNVEATRPYDQHKPYNIIHGQLLLHRNGNIVDLVNMWQLSTLYLLAFESRPEVSRRISAVKTAVALLHPYENIPYNMNGRAFDVGEVERYDLNAALVQIPAYPAEPKRTIAHAGLIASYDKKADKVRAAGSGLTFDAGGRVETIEAETSGFEAPKIEFWYRPDPWQNVDIQPLRKVPGYFDERSRFLVDDKEWALPTGSRTPLVIRVTEGDARSLDFFGQIVYISSAPPPAILVYDGDCSFCRNHVRLSRFRKTIGEVVLIDARSGDPRLKVYQTRGGLNDGMLFDYCGQIFHGADALHVLGSLSTSSSTFNKLNRLMLSNRLTATFLYPLSKAGRRITLAVIGKGPID